MELISINVGRPRSVEWKGRSVRTGIFKSPVSVIPAASGQPERVGVGRLNLAGDEQADLEVHGGPDKAVYVYPSEHYGPWGEELSGVELPWGAFGENLTTRGDELLESAVRIGDRLRAGTVELVVTQPRLPCYKLGIRLGTDEVIRRMVETGRCGFYCAVTREGELGAGDPVTVAERDVAAPSIDQLFRLRTGGALADGEDPEEILGRAALARSLPAEWREHFLARLEALEG